METKTENEAVSENSEFTVIVQNWWESFPARSRSRGNIAGGLVIIENLRDNLDFDIQAHKAPGSDQLKNATRTNVQKILSRFGEERVLLQEGGRTNRGLMKNLTSLLEALSSSSIEALTPQNIDAELLNMQSFLVERAREKFNAEKLSFEYRKDMTSRELIGLLLDSARKRRKSGRCKTGLAVSEI